MSAVVVDPSWVTLTLDTHPPVVSVVADDSVDPPAAWDVVLVANEEIGGATFTVEDAFGTLTPVGYEAVDARTLRVTVPSEGLSNGPSVLRGSVWDQVCNDVGIESRVFVRRLAPFEGELTVSGAFDVDEGIDHGFYVEWQIVGAFEAALTIDRAWSVESDITPAFDATLEVKRA